MSAGGEAGPERRTSSRLASAASTRLKVSASSGFRSRVGRAPSRTLSKQPSQQQQQVQPALTILQRRDRLRVLEAGEDVTPRGLVHPGYGLLDERRTAFEQIQLGSSRATSLFQLAGQTGRPSLATVSSFSSVYTLDEILQPPGRRDSSAEPADAPEDDGDDDDAPSQYRLPRFDSREFLSPSDPVTITLKETETQFLFELAQLTEDATTEAGLALIAENERYARERSGRKTVASETQTAQLYTKTRGTHLGRRERRNRATFVNNWVMHDALLAGPDPEDRPPPEVERFKFPEPRAEKSGREPAEQLLERIGAGAGYEDAARVTLRILASKEFETAQRRFAGLLPQDPCDPGLELVYGLELLWRYSSPEARLRPVSAFRWNPANSSLLAVGYADVLEQRRSKTEELAQDGLVMVWCAKNPTQPDRCFKFESPVSDLDWSRSQPNLLAVGFYDGQVRVIDVSSKQLAVVRQSERKTLPSYEPHWQVQWWPIGVEPHSQQPFEQLYTSNQDGRVCFFPSEGEFASREILRVQRVEGRIPGVRRANRSTGPEVPIGRSPGALVLRRQPGREPGAYLVGTEEGCVLRCSLGQPHGHLGAFVAHDGPVYGLECSPFCGGRLLLSCGADWAARLWAQGLDEPLLTFATRMACVTAVTWSPTNSTVFASAVANEICIWELGRKGHRPASVTRVAPEGIRLTRLEFTRGGEQLVAADERGEVYVHGLTGMPLPAFDQERRLLGALAEALVTRPELLTRLRKLGPPFDAC